MEPTTDPRYRPPTSDIDLADAPLDLEPASRGRRFANLLIDYVGAIGTVFVVAFAWALLGGDLSILEGDSTSRDWLLGIGAMLLYYLPLEAQFGITLGKLITGTRVVNEDGRQPRFMQILGRTLARFIPFEPFSFFGTPPRGWHSFPAPGRCW